MSGDDLVRFVIARINDDEAAVRRLLTATATTALHITDRPLNEWIMSGGPGLTERQMAGRVLAECAAKRAIVYAYVKARSGAPDDANSWHRSVGLGLAVRSLASVHAEHPDFDQAWKPGTD